MGWTTHLVRQDEEGVLGVEERLIAQQKGRAAGVPAAVVLLAGAGVHERVVHRGIVMRPT